jgi:hypothetical protein
MKLLAMVVLGTGVVWAISMAPLHNLPGEPAGLTSEIREEREAAAQAMCQQRAKIIKDLISLAATKVEPAPSDNQGFPQDGVWHDAKHLAILLLGDLRASEAVPALMENLCYRNPESTNMPRLELRYGGFAYPAARSLSKIGMPAVQPLLARLGVLTATAPEREICLWTLREILGEGLAKAQVEIAMEKAKTDAARANLKAALAAGIPWLAAGGIAAKPAGTDMARIEALNADVEAAQRKLGEAAQALIATAQDPSRPREERRQAIFILGKIKSPESVQFLIDNVSLRIPMSIALGDEEMAKSWPCCQALIEGEDWGMAKAVLDALGRPRSAEDVMHMAYVLERILSRPIALVAVDNMAKESTGALKENLAAVKAILTK